jgi:hypothetical protein
MKCCRREPLPILFRHYRKRVVYESSLKGYSCREFCKEIVLGYVFGYTPQTFIADQEDL